MAGTITATTIQNDTSSPPTFRNNSVEIGRLCRAWVKYNGNTQAIGGSFNVSSVTYNGTGSYVVNFTNAMPDANYSAVGASQGGSNSGAATSIFVGYSTYSTTAFDVQIGYNNGSGYVNSSVVNLAVFSS